MVNCNPVIPVMDWTEDAELHKRYVEWREEAELELGSSLSGKSNTVKSMCSHWQGSQLETILTLLIQTKKNLTVFHPSQVSQSLCKQSLLSSVTSY